MRMVLLKRWLTSLAMFTTQRSLTNCLVNKITKFYTELSLLLYFPIFSPLPLIGRNNSLDFAFI
jgi:hypothetical protein